MEPQETRCLIDSSALIGLLDASDPLSEKAVTLFRHIQNLKIRAYISDYILQETFTVLLYKQKSELLLETLDLLRKDPLFVLFDIDLSTLIHSISFAKQRSFRPKMSMTDWTLAYLSTTHQIPLVSFDKQLNRACKKFT